VQKSARIAEISTKVRGVSCYSVN